jgi:hypothetical protein
MYDKRTPYQVANKALTFNFSPRRYEIWSGGQLIDNGLVEGIIKCTPSFFSEVISEVKLIDFPDFINIGSTLLFDITFTSVDRIYLATVPRETNINDYNSFQSFKNNVPLGFQIITREKRDFDENEPYVCSVFTINNSIEKISFSFGNSPRLIEFYNV